MDITVENAGFDDLPSILKLQQLCYQENAERYGDYNILPLVETVGQVQDDFKVLLFLKAVDGSKIIGSVRAYEKEGTVYIGRLIVHPGSQNRGIGKRLLAEIENRFPSAARFELFTAHRDEKNISFYKKNGYSIFKEEKHSDRINFVFFEKTRL